MAYRRGVRTRQVLTATLMLTVLLGAGLWGLQASQAARPASHYLWEPEYEGLRSPNPEVRAETVQKIRVTQDSHAVPVLLLYLADPDQKVGLYVAQTLGDMAEEDALAALRAALSDGNPNIRWRAALALGEQKDARAVPRLAQLLRDPDRLVQNMAANALARIATKEAIGALGGALANPQESTVHTTMDALMQLGETAVPALAVLVNSGSPQARRNAATVLGYIASPLAVPALQEAAADTNQQVQAEARWALEEISKKQKQ